MKNITIIKRDGSVAMEIDDIKEVDRILLRMKDQNG